MDTSGFCQVGRHGTLSLLKSQDLSVGDAAGSILTSFGIDDDELTFGSSTACSVRLYYSDVDSLHCKIVFDQFKAFLTILGSSGVVVDECRVFPHTSGGTSGSMQQTIIPLNNNSIFEIHGKRFKFNSPPKELRKALYATPARPPQRALRLSMIHSAQVFSPRPSNDPRENLRILQSPMRRPSSPIKNSSPLKSAILPDIEEEEIVLVQTNHPRVVEEEKDLVILEDVPVRLLSPIKNTIQQTNQFPMIQAQLQPPCTPRRRSLGGTALHRAVLIRSAQRAVLKAEKEMEEEQEELEVLGTVVGMGDVDDEITLKTIETEEMGDVESDEDDETEDEDEDGEPEGQTQKSLWRKSFEQIIPWSLGDSGVEAEDKDLQDVEADGATTKEAEYWKEEPVGLFTAQPSRKVLGSFMTPQPRHQTRTIDSKKVPAAQAGRFSLGGQARRILVEQPWKVHDLVLPPTTPSKSDSKPFMPIDPPSPNPLGFDRPLVASPWRRAGAAMNGNSIPAITDEERKAIQERRRSAVRELNSTPFWAGGAPGMSPTKGGLDPSNVLSPNKPVGAGSPSKKFNSGSPTKAQHSHYVGREEDDNQSKDDEDLDTSGLLDKIKETVNDMKRRRSVILSGSNVMGMIQPPTSEPEELPTPDANPTVVREGSPMRIDFTKIGTPSKYHPTHKISPQKSSSNAEEHTETAHQEEPFSLLRPGALEGRRQSILSTPVRKERVVTVVPVPLIIVEDTSMDKSEEPPKETVTRGGTRLLRSGSDLTEEDVGMEDEGSDTKSQASKIDTAKPPSARRQRSKTPQPQMSADAASEMPSVDVSQRASRSAARGKVTTADTAPKHIPEETDTVEKPATRRVRKAHIIDKGEEEAKPTPVAPKRGRPRKNPVPIEKSQEDTRPAGKSTSKVRSRKTPTRNTKETDSEDDPLDSYEIGGTPPLEEDQELALDLLSTPEAQSKTKPQVPATKGKVATRIKQEEPLALPVAATRVRRSAKANTDSQMADATPAVKGPTGRPRGRPKTPATAPATTGTSVAEEKENTLGSRSKLKPTEKVANPEAEELPVKLRVSRSRAAPSTRNTAKATEQDDEQPLPRQRATRVTRTRTKTG